MKSVASGRKSALEASASDPHLETGKECAKMCMKKLGRKGGKTAKEKPAVKAETAKWKVKEVSAEEAEAELRRLGCEFLGKVATRLERHNRWRRGDETVKMGEPKVLGRDLEVAVLALRFLASDADLAVPVANLRVLQMRFAQLRSNAEELGAFLKDTERYTLFSEKRLLDKSNVARKRLVKGRKARSEGEVAVRIGERILKDAEEREKIVRPSRHTPPAQWMGGRA